MYGSIDLLADGISCLSEKISLLNVNNLSGQMGLIVICDIFFFPVVVLHVVLSWADHAVNLDKKKNQPNQKDKAQ